MDASASDTRSSGYAACTMNHGALNSASQQIVAGYGSAYQVVPPYLVQVTPDEINVYVDMREITLLMGSGGPSYG